MTCKTSGRRSTTAWTGNLNRAWWTRAIMALAHTWVTAGWVRLRADGGTGRDGI